MRIEETGGDWMNRGEAMARSARSRIEINVRPTTSIPGARLDGATIQKSLTFSLT